MVLTRTIVLSFVQLPTSSKSILMRWRPVLQMLEQNGIAPVMWVSNNFSLHHVSDYTIISISWTILARDGYCSAFSGFCHSLRFAFYRVVMSDGFVTAAWDLSIDFCVFDFSHDLLLSHKYPAFQPTDREQNLPTMCYALIWGSPGSHLYPDLGQSLSFKKWFIFNLQVLEGGIPNEHGTWQVNSHRKLMQWVLAGKYVNLPKMPPTQYLVLRQFLMCEKLSIAGNWLQSMNHGKPANISLKLNENSCQ